MGEKATLEEFLLDNLNACKHKEDQGMYLTSG
jgi:hypothetical protein